MSEVRDEDLIRIMVATDSHLGFSEKDAIRGDDSFVAFEEMLEKAVAEDVDFILLGGDLFHDAVPSQNALHKCMRLLRCYTFGDKAISLEFLSDQSANFFNSANQTVNYEDPNLNVSIPVFSIHGNHDDPIGFGKLSSLDLLSTTGLVNYFGRWTDLKQVDINPILLSKGETQLALYGLSHIHDARLARLFEAGKVAMKRPSRNEETEQDEEWFHLMVLHQNRADRGLKNYLPEEALPDFFNLIIWGHEHDCRIEPEYNATRSFYVSQPGSSVATSLAAGEALPKHVGLLEIHKTRFQMKPLPLQTVRPFVFDSVNLDEMIDELGLDEGDAVKKVTNFAEKRILEMIEQAKEQLTGHAKQPTLPLIRLRLVYSQEAHMFNAIRFGQRFSGKVANPTELLNFKKNIKRTKHEAVELNHEAMRNAAKMEIDSATRVEDLIDRYFAECNKTERPFQAIPAKALSEMCHRMVDRNDLTAPDTLLAACNERALKFLLEKLPADEEVFDLLHDFNEQLSVEDVCKMLDGTATRSGAAAGAASKTAASKTAAAKAAKAETSVVDNNANVTASSRGRGRGGRGARGASTARGARTTAAARAKPELDVSVNNTRSSRSSTIIDLIGGAGNARAGIRSSGRSKNDPVIISDDSD